MGGRKESKRSLSDGHRDFKFEIVFDWINKGSVVPNTTLHYG